MDSIFSAMPVLGLCAFALVGVLEYDLTRKSKRLGLILPLLLVAVSVALALLFGSASAGLSILPAILLCFFAYVAARLVCFIRVLVRNKENAKPGIR